MTSSICHIRSNLSSRLASSGKIISLLCRLENLCPSRCFGVRIYALESGLIDQLCLFVNFINKLYHEPCILPFTYHMNQVMILSSNHVDSLLIHWDCSPKDGCNCLALASHRGAELIFQLKKGQSIIFLGNLFDNSH